MKLIEKFESAQAQTWWLPQSAEVHEGPDHCFYDDGERFNVVRFNATEQTYAALLDKILQTVGTRRVRFTFLPHRHGETVLKALKAAGFKPGHRHEARAIHVDHYTRKPPQNIRTVMVETFDDMKRVYALRHKAFGSDSEESDENIRLYFEAASKPHARVRQFLAVDAQSGEPLSQAAMSLFPDLRFSFLFAGATLEHARGRGAYTALVEARVRYARSVGIEHVGLFAREETSAPIVSRQGFKQCGEMHYWIRNTS